MRRQITRLDSKKTSTKNQLNADHSVMQVSSPFQNEVLKAVSKHASSHASFDHSVEPLSQAELTHKRREAKRDEILLNIASLARKQTLKMGEIERGMQKKTGSQKRDRSGEDL